MSLFLVSQVTRSRKVTKKRAKQAVDLQRLFAAPTNNLSPEDLNTQMEQANAMALHVFCFECSSVGSWKIAMKQCRGCYQWFCKGHMVGNRCQMCHDLHVIKSNSKKKSLINR